MNIEGEYCLYEIENYKLNTFNCGKFIDYIKQNISNELSAFDSVIKSASITLVNSHVYDDNKNDKKGGQKGNNLVNNSINNSINKQNNKEGDEV